MPHSRPLSHNKHSGSLSVLVTLSILDHVLPFAGYCSCSNVNAGPMCKIKSPTRTGKNRHIVSFICQIELLTEMTCPDIHSRLGVNFLDHIFPDWPNLAHALLLYTSIENVFLRAFSLKWQFFTQNPQSLVGRTDIPEMKVPFRCFD